MNDTAVWELTIDFGDGPLRDRVIGTAEEIEALANELAKCPDLERVGYAAETQVMTMEEYREENAALLDAAHM